MSEFRKLLKEWIPPAVLNAVRRARARGRRPDWEYCPEGWKTAAPEIEGWNVASVREAQQSTWAEFVRLANGTGPLGINHTDLVPTGETMSAHNTAMAFAYVLALAAGGKPSVSLLDWGGGIGHYAVLARSLLPGTWVEYYCKEVPVLCEGGRAVLPGDTFFSRDEECRARTYDLVMASGSLHYSVDWKSTLRLLAEVSAAYVYITRLPVVREAPSFVVVQRPHACGYETEYLGWFLNQSELLAGAGEAGLRLVREFLVDERPEVHNAPEQAQYRGFLFRHVG
jgi:putative methyltransferase (TIGR04325 family)